MVQSYSPGGANVHPHLVHGFPGPTLLSMPNGVSIGLAIFAPLTAESPILYTGLLPSPQYCPCAWGYLDAHLIHGSLDTRKSTNQMAS